MSAATKPTPLYPEVKVRLVGEDGNAFVIIGRVSSALRTAGHSDAVESFREEATSGDYSHVIATCAKYVTVK